MPSHHLPEPCSSVHINDLLIQLPNGLSLSSFSLPPPRAPCTIILSLACHLLPSAIPASALVDDLPSDQSVNYSVLSKKVFRLVQEGMSDQGDRDGGSAWTSLEELGNAVITLCIQEYGSSLHTIVLNLRRPKALLFSRSVSLHVQHALTSSSSSSHPSIGSKNSSSWQRTENELSIDGITAECVLGLNPHERKEKQQVELDLRLKLPDQAREDEYGFNYKAFGTVAHQYLLDSSFQTIESLVHNLAHHLLLNIPTSAPRIQSSTNTSNNTSPSTMFSPRTDIPVTVEICKPHAIAFASSSSVRITRCLLDYPNSIPPNDGTSKPTSPVLAWIAIGSNIGDRIRHVSDAVKTLCELDKTIKVTRTSELYESKAMYVEDQADFLNGAFEIETILSPIDLLLLLKRTEKSLGRSKTMVNGPRVIDLDLLFYDVTEVMGHGSGIVRAGSKGDKEGSLGDGCGWLEVPHWGVKEREFVLRPLCDFADSRWQHPTLNVTVPSLLASLASPPTLKLLIPFQSPISPMALNPTRPLIMGILNITPDSFSDGDESRVSNDSLENVVNLAKQLIADGADIIDIGGMSTRPGVTTESVTETEELSRVIPVIQALWLEGLKVPISIDTFRPVVAKEAILAGASCINDVRGGKEEGMLEVMAEMNVPVVLMHSRGDSVSMSGPEATDYSALGGVVSGVRVEMEEMVERAERAGVKRWNIILDPGIGFAKSVDGNMTLLRNLDKLVVTDSKLHNYPMLVGASRKRFVGTITGKKQPKEREYGNAAVTSMCCASGVVHVIRVHEPGPAKDVISMWEA